MARLPDDITVVYYSANRVPEAFAATIRAQIAQSAKGLPIISVTHRPIDFGDNYVVDFPYHHLSIYKQALLGAQYAKTKYLALTEDDVLYSPAHFKYRPQQAKFAYNIAYWGLYTWTKPPVLSWKGRRNLSQLICEREAFIRVVEERLALDNRGEIIWGEPGKYEARLGLSVNNTETFYAHPANIMFSHETAMAFGNLGTRKRLGELRAYEVPYWGHAEEILKIYREAIP